MFRTSPFLATALIALALMGFGSPASAREDKESGYDQVWAIANLYTGDDDSFFQTIDLSGRLQLDLAYVKSQDDDAGEFNVRRFRFGFKTVFLEDFTLHVEGEFNPQEIEPLYTRITDAYLAWAPGKAVKLTLGKHSAGFTLDGLTSSKRLLTIDRNNLTQNIWFTEEYIPGISVKGEGKGLVYHVGLFSSGDKDPEFGDFKGGKFILINVGHDFADRLGAKEALLRFNYIDNEPDPENGFTKLLEQIWSLNFKFEDDGWGFRTDISAGYGYEDQSDMWGYVLMPFYELTDSLELVGRYTHIHSDEENDVRLARYERLIGGGKGDRYDEAYLGLNYYWYGHKLKLQNAIQYVDMKDKADDGGAYTGWSWTTAIRIYW
jgi:phosphate-selective porin OprO/OprP